MKKEANLIMSMVLGVIILFLTSNCLYAQGEKTDNNIGNEIGTSTEFKEELGTKTQQLYQEKINRLIEGYFPKDIEKAYGYRESQFIEKDLEPDAGGKGTQTALKAPVLSENEMVVTYTNGFDGKVVIFKKKGGEYTPVWESPLRFMGYFITVEKIEDINNDGQKEIIIRGAVGARGYPGIWIYSWDGNSGRLISPTRNNGESTKFVSSAGFDRENDIKDLDGDGIKEVIIHQYSFDEPGPDPTASEQQIYKWNPDEQVYKLWKKEEEWRKQVQSEEEQTHAK